MPNRFNFNSFCSRENISCFTYFDFTEVFFQALLSGCSAGGLASIIHCDEFRELFPATTKVKCLSDAGLFLDRWKSSHEISVLTLELLDLLIDHYSFRSISNNFFFLELQCWRVWRSHSAEHVQRCCLLTGTFSFIYFLLLFFCFYLLTIR